MIYLVTRLALLSEYLEAQTYDGPAKWLVVDDCDPASHVPTTRFDTEVIRPDWSWRPGMNTQSRSMARLLRDVPRDASVVVLEDDDAYLPGHLDAMVAALEHHDLVGEREARYYNVATRRWKSMRGLRHSSLAATACRGEALKLLKSICENGRQRFIDLRLWKTYSGTKQLLDTANVVGIKGLPGRPGIGAGHRAGRNPFGRPDDTGKLAEWIGEERARAYTRYRV